MTNRAIRVVLSALLTAFAITAAAQQLNPTVTLLKSPAAPVPNGCDQSLAPQPAPRVEVAQIPVPEPPARKVMAAPPTASVRAQLKDVQNAADRGDRDGFRDALTRLKATLATYPAGGEKSAAENVIRVYDDLDRIWTYQMETPTGAFFDAASVPGQIMRGYPGFERAMTDQVLVGANGTRFYPTTETREFLVREAAARLKTLGVAVATRAPRTPIVVPRVAPVKPRPAEKSEQRAAGSEQEKPATAHARPAHKRRAETKVAEVHEKTAAKHVEEKTSETAAAGSMKTTEPAHPAPKRRVKPAAKKAEKAVAEKPASAPVSTSAAPATATTVPVKPAAPKTETTATTASTASPAETTSSAPAPETTATAPATSTSATTSAASTDTTATEAATDTSASTDTTGTAAKGQPQGKGVILPIILIVVGIGVLIVLFRASS